MNELKFKGTLTVQVKRGVVYFHAEDGTPLLRIEGIPKPIPNPANQQIDIRLVPQEIQEKDWDRKDREFEGYIRAVLTK